VALDEAESPYASLEKVINPCNDVRPSLSLHRPGTPLASQTPSGQGGSLRMVCAYPKSHRAVRSYECWQVRLWELPVPLFRGPWPAEGAVSHAVFRRAPSTLSSFFSSLRGLLL